MAFNTHHSADSWSDGGLAGNNSKEGSGNPEPISWADIQKSLDTSSISGMNYGKGALARNEGGGFSGFDQPSLSPATMHGNNELPSNYSEGFGLAQAGVSPFRGIDLSSDNNFYRSKTQGEVVGALPLSSESGTASAPRLNSSLLRVLGNLQQKRDGVSESTGSTSDRTSAVSTTDAAAKLDIGLAIAPGAEVREPGRVARAVVRLPEAAEPAAPAEAPVRKVEAPAPPVFDRLDDPFRFVNDQRAEIGRKFGFNNVKGERTTLLPDGSVVEVKTASDNTTLSTKTGKDGSSSVVQHDRYRRPMTEQDTRPDGTWSFSMLAYNDNNGIKPFCAEKLTVHSDGSQVRMQFGKLGQIETKTSFA